MRKNKIVLDGYMVRNLGDDLFFYILSNRYDEKFVAYVCPKFDYHKDLLNIKFNRSGVLFYLKKYKNKILKKIHNKRSKKVKIGIVIGGSIFIEPEDFESIEKIYSLPYKENYILGANFGPYTKDSYKEMVRKEVITQCKDVCFRDKKSYNLFKDMPNVRMASDIVFSMDLSKINILNSNKVIISIINLKYRNGLSVYQKQYKEKIKGFINFFKEKGYSVTLMSFCMAEKDEELIEEILDEIKDTNVNKYFYRKNINEAINIIGDSKIIVGTRFHANILGMIMNKTVIPIAYSDKTINVLKDINFKGRFFDVRDMENFDVNSLTDEDLNYKIDVSFQKKDAERQFQALDKILKRRKKDE